MDLWQISEERFDFTPKQLHSQETVFTIGNGYFGTRGTFEEGSRHANPATLMFGVFDDIPIAREELANVPDWVPLKLFVNGERFRLDEGRILSYRRTLDMQRGMLLRTVRWQSPNDIIVTIESERIASLADEHVGAIRYSVTAEQQDIDIVLWASINSAVGNYNVMHWDTVDQSHENDIIWLLSETKMTHVQLAQSMSFTTTAPFEQEIVDSDVAPSIRLRGRVAAGTTVTVEKIVVMYTSRDNIEPVRAALKHHRTLIAMAAMQPEPNIHQAFSLDAANTTTASLSPVAQPSTQHEKTVYATISAQHIEAWRRYWETADVIIEGDALAQIGIRYSIYQLRINASAHDSRYSIAAKGLTGFGYRGHVFHDTEIFMLPFFTYVMPEIARNLILYRYHLLPAARQKASNNGYDGAQYPWESTLNGEETTPPAIVHPETGEVIAVLNGSLEIHITASIAHSVMDYWHVTGDDDFMARYGTEMMLSTAMFWVSRVEYNVTHNDYEITNVIGPDEWHEHVNNNAFTNYMAKNNIEKALIAWEWLQQHHPLKAQMLAHQFNLTEERFAHWHDVVAHLRIPQSPTTKLFEQFDGFFKLETLNQELYKGRTDSYQGIFGLEHMQKYRMIKQADVLMLLTVLSSQFDLQTKKVNWDYYYPITDHDYGSSLTPAFHVILACQLGLQNEAYELFMKGALVDIQNLRGNTPEGIHAACAGAVWQAAILGFAGLQVTADGYKTNPHLPDKWTRLAFTCQYKGEHVQFDLRR